MFRSARIIFAVFLWCTFPLLASGEYSVGFAKIEAVSKETSENISVAVVYPTYTPSEAVRFGPFGMELAIDAAIAEGKFPVAIISHGSDGSNLGHRSIAFALVRHGFIVGMPLHPKNNYQDNTAEGTVGNWMNRPKQIKATIDALLSHPKVASSIDTNKISLIGHSAGGYTALAVAGGIAKTDHIIDLCKSNIQLNAPFCGRVKDNALAPVTIENQPDVRVKALILMAPVGILFKSKDSLAQVNVPVLLLRAEMDRELTEPHQSEVIANNLKNKAQLTYRTIRNAGHYSFITPFPEAVKSEIGVVAEDPEGFDRAEFHETLGTEITTYLLGVLQ